MPEPTIIQLAIDSVWSTLQSKELYIITLGVLVMWAVLPRRE